MIGPVKNRSFGIKLALLVAPFLLAGCNLERLSLTSETLVETPTCASKEKQAGCRTKVAKNPRAKRAAAKSTPRLKPKTMSRPAVGRAFAGWRLRLSDAQDRKRVNQKDQPARPMRWVVGPADPDAAIDNGGQPIASGSAR